MTETEQLLREYREHGSETAFRELVHRYIDLVYSVALRNVGGDAHLAEDVSQTVFSDLARKGRSLPPSMLLGGWLHRHTCFVSSTLMRTERRRRVREQQAMEMNVFDNSPDSQWQQLEPVLDSVLNQLDANDRNALVLRFFERRDFRAIGSVMGISDDAAQKRVARALDRLRVLLGKRGVTLSAGALAILLGSRAIQAAPVGLAARVIGPALSTSSIGAITLTILKIMASTKLKLSLATVILAACIVAPVVYKASHPSVAKGIVTAQDKSLMTDSPSPVEIVKSVETPGESKTPSSVTTNKNVLHLTVLAADTGRPLRDAGIFLWGDDERLAPRWTSDNNGQCDIPLNAKRENDLTLHVRKELFAVTRLQWHVQNGDEIPASYMLKMIRGVTVSGLVLDPEDRALPGAEIGINAELDTQKNTAIESHALGYLTKKTDAAGRWEITEIPLELMNSLNGGVSHSDYARVGFSTVSSKEVEQQLREGSYICKMGSAVVVRGIVVNTNEEPVAGADVLVGNRGETSSRDGKTGTDGTFAIKGCKMGRGLLTANAGGFAPTTMPIEVGSNMAMFKLVLQSGKPLSIRVVNADNKPISGADVWLNTRHGDHRAEINKSESNAPVVQAEFHEKTDSEGHVTWQDAPDQTQYFQIGAEGYLAKYDIEVQPDGEDHVVVMDAGLTVYGAVVDAATRQPIPEFQLVCGSPRFQYLTDQYVPLWSSFDRFTIRFKNGEFKHQLTEGVIMNDTNYLFKIQADGYSPYISRIIHANEGEVRLDVELTKSKQMLVRVLKPDLQPAALVDVGLVSAGSQLDLVPGGISRRNIQSGGSLMQTDQDGWFRFTSDTNVTQIIVLAPEGFASATQAELETRPILTLQPWGSVELEFATTNHPAEQAYMLESVDMPSTSIHLNYTAYCLKEDAQGKVIWQQAPPFRVRVSKVYDEGNGRRSWGHNLNDPGVQVIPGETVKIPMNE